MTVVTSDPSVILGVTHLLVEGQYTPLLKCPFCNFRNIHEDTITHHIKFTDDSQHKDVDIEQLDKSRYIVTRVTKKESPYGPYISKEDIKLPWIRCLFCNYKDKIEWDLAQHMFEKHKKSVQKLPISFADRRQCYMVLDPCFKFFSKFEPLIEFKLDVAVEMAKKENRGLGSKHAIRSIQKQMLKRQKKKENAGID